MRRSSDQIRVNSNPDVKTVPMGSSLHEEDDIIESPLLSQNQMDVWMEAQNGVVNESFYDKRWFISYELKALQQSFISFFFLNLLLLMRECG